jgi:predicted nuclease of predicted toxin-antitoxin system
MKILIDMNLSPDWVEFLNQAGHDAIHWSSVGNASDDDPTILRWARQDNRLLFTHDLDFGTLLALTQAESPSVVQVRAQNILPSHLANTVIAVLRANEETLEQGALIVIDEGRARVRILPLQKRS